jgi:hypothetical protein
MLAVSPLPVRTLLLGVERLQPLLVRQQQLLPAHVVIVLLDTSGSFA